MEFDKRYKQLNDRQRQAVNQIDGPVMVIAGPGTGKTELLSIRAANILKNTDTLPENILCLTFTESGAAAMRERLVGIVGKDAYKVAVHTFHSFGTEIINKNREYFYNNALFSPADELSQYEILKGIFGDLDHNNPLSVTMNGEFTYLPDARNVISELKRAGGMTSDELLAVIQQDEDSLDIVEKILIPIISNRVSKKMIPALESALADIQQEAQKVQPVYEVTPLINIVASSLELAIDRAIDEDSTKPISAWKSEWIGRNEQKEPVFKNRERLLKLKHLSFIYYEYLRRMESASLYDYDDMILQIVHALEVHDDLRASLQEQYLYIMVDEFQDTNVAQMRILHSLTDNPVNEGAPNLLTVGDDDQAVYGFQGADVSNMINFRKQYPTAQLIVLTDNYRSGASILESSRQVITQGSDRLEAVMPELNKNLSAQQTETGLVDVITHESIHAERYWVAQEVKSILEKTSNSRIAILARRHGDLQEMLPYLNKANVPVRYEKQDNALDQPPIKSLVLLARTITALAQGDHQQADALLPELLSHPAWKIEPRDIWKLSLDSYSARQNWMQIMETTPVFADTHQLLVESVVNTHNLSLEESIDRLIGHDTENPSPLFEYYFGEKALTESPEQYIDYLSALRAIRAKIGEYKTEGTPTLETLVSLVDTYNQLGLTINTPRVSLGSDIAAVDLLTAHKSKGLEYDHVYIIHSIDSRWGQSARTRSRSISYPENLPLAPAGETADERLRLFYVAMTRAKSRLTLTYSERDDRDRASLAADFITATNLEPANAPELEAAEQIEVAEVAWSQKLTQTSSDLETILKPYLDTYRLSATSFTSFLDVTKGGPQGFLLNNILRFPRTSSPAISYGNAVHYALQQAHIHFAAREEQKPLEDILHDFEQALEGERLNDKDKEAALQKGSDHLPIFLASPEVSFTADQKAELAFAHQEVQLDGARLTGKIDVASLDNEELSMTITDYKTGRPPLSWKGYSEYEKMKLHHYRQQLLFYKILVEESRDYSKYRVNQGRIAFVQPTKSGSITILDMEFESEELERTKVLVKSVWERIMSLNLPDTSSYPDTLKGILAFEQDIIDGNL